MTHDVRVLGAATNRRVATTLGAAAGVYSRTAPRGHRQSQSRYWAPAVADPRLSTPRSSTETTTQPRTGTCGLMACLVPVSTGNRRCRRCPSRGHSWPPAGRLRWPRTLRPAPGTCRQHDASRRRPPRARDGPGSVVRSERSTKVQPMKGSAAPCAFEGSRPPRTLTGRVVRRFSSLAWNEDVWP